MMTSELGTTPESFWPVSTLENNNISPSSTTFQNYVTSATTTRTIGSLPPPPHNYLPQSQFPQSSSFFNNIITT